MTMIKYAVREKIIERDNSNRIEFHIISNLKRIWTSTSKLSAICDSISGFRYLIPIRPFYLFLNLFLFGLYTRNAILTNDDLDCYIILKVCCLTRVILELTDFFKIIR